MQQGLEAFVNAESSAIDAKASQSKNTLLYFAYAAERLWEQRSKLIHTDGDVSDAIVAKEFVTYMMRATDDIIKRESSSTKFTYSHPVYYDQDEPLVRISPNAGHSRTGTTAPYKDVDFSGIETSIRLGWVKLEPAFQVVMTTPREPPWPFNHLLRGMTYTPDPKCRHYKAILTDEGREMVNGYLSIIGRPDIDTLRKNSYRGPSLRETA